MKYNIFEFAPSELSHSAFFAWLVGQLDPDAKGYSSNVSEQSLKFVNECLNVNNFKPIENRNNISSVEVLREEKHIDITAYIKLEDKRQVALIIENKIGTHESTKNQLKDYYTIGTQLAKNHLDDKKKIETSFIYLKSDFDFDDPLKRLNSKGDEVIPKQFKIIDTNFKKIGWEKLYKLFKDNKRSDDSILKSYSVWITNRYNSIKSMLNTSSILSDSGENLLKSHVAQVHLVKQIFKNQFGNRPPVCAEKDKWGYMRFYYEHNFFIKLGTDKGLPWTELWFTQLQENLYFFYRLQSHKAKGPLLRACLGYWGSQNLINQKEKLRDIYIEQVKQHGLQNICIDFLFNPKNYQTTMQAFIVIDQQMNTLEKIEELNKDFLQKLA